MRKRERVSAYTVGHSTRTIEEFLGLLQQYGIKTLVDVRSHPGSHKMPHFNQDALAASLKDQGITYHHVPQLGGFRKKGLGEESPNFGLHSSSFRNYADHMQSPEFQSALEILAEWAAEAPTVFMCAEKLYFRCHRFLISDALFIRGVNVIHITDPGKTTPHRLSGMAEPHDKKVTYPIKDEPRGA